MKFFFKWFFICLYTFTAAVMVILMGGMAYGMFVEYILK